MCIKKNTITVMLSFLFGFCLIGPIPADPIADSPLLLRSFNVVFPGLQDSQKSKVFSVEGYRNSFERNGSLSVVPHPGSGIDLYSVVLEKKPSHFIEALMVIPYNGKQFTIMDAYNALGRIEDIKNHFYFSSNRNANIHIFEESSRIESEKRTKSIPDPSLSGLVPASEQIFLYLKDRNFGNIYVRADLSTNQYGLTFNAINFKTIRFFIFPVMRAEKFCAILYVEPLDEGMLLYGMAAVDIPDFVASRINIASAIERRLNVFIAWLNKGLEKTE